jgi:hypothetical protein
VRHPFRRRRSLMTGVFVALCLAAPPAAAAAPAETFTSSVTVPTELFTVNPCNGEEVTITGTSHVIGHFTVDPAGGTHVVLFAVNGQGLTGTGATGTQYQVVNSDHQNLSFDFDGAVFTTTRVAQTRLVSEGSSPNFLVVVRQHVTVTASGEITVEYEIIETRCEG